MQSQNEYIGDDKFQKLLEHYKCPTGIDLIKMRFAGAICSPNLELRPTDVISSLWPQGQEPRLQTKEEAELFFKFFMGLWDDIFAKVRQNKIALPTFKVKNRDELCKICTLRHDLLEYGWLEGFWGGCENIKIPAYIAQIVDSLSDLAKVYLQLGQRQNSSNEFENLHKAVLHTDKTTNRALSFIIENYVASRFEKGNTESKI